VTAASSNPATPPSIEVRAAYRRCEEITWSQARNFSYGIRLLPPAKRQALAAVYAFARRIDDIGDGTLPAPEKLTALEDARAALSGLMAGGPRDPGDQVLVALADAANRFDIPLAAFGELIDGCAADVRGVTYATFDDLLHYCRCVAGSIGRLSLGVFGTANPQQAVPLADSLGVALQLTNILRDIREDYASGRVYLPAEDFARFGCALGGSSFPGPGDGSSPPAPGDGSSPPAPGDGSSPPAPGDGSAAALPPRAAALPPRAAALPPLAADPAWDQLTALVEFEADRARTWYAKGLALMPLLDRRSAASAGAMAGIYYRLLEHIAASPAAVLTRRVSLSPREKALVAARSLAATAVRPPRPRGPGSSRPATGTAR
jgi:15-cis-phytoene synthase